MAALHAERLYNSGDLPARRVSAWITAETAVRVRAELAGETLSTKQLRTRVRWRLAGRGIWKGLKLLGSTLLPGGKVAFDVVDSTIETAVAAGKERARAELERRNELEKTRTR